MIDGTGSFLKESKRGHTGTWDSFSRLSGLSARFPNSRFFSEYYQPQVNKGSIAEVPVLSGAFFMVKRDVLEKAGGFDERYFMYAEDIDLSLTIKRLGYSNIYFGEETVLLVAPEKVTLQAFTGNVSTMLNAPSTCRFPDIDIRFTAATVPVFIVLPWST